MSTDLQRTRAAASVASFIGVVKWVLIALYVVTAVVSVVLAAIGSGGTDSGNGLPVPEEELADAVGGVFVVGSIGWAIIGSLFTWVLFGWFQHTLGMLSTIARNTQRAASTSYVS